MRPTQATNVFRSVIDTAANAVDSAPIQPPGYLEPTAYFKKPAASVGTINLNASYLPDLLPDEGGISSIPMDVIQTPGGERLTVAAGILQLSRVAAMGSHIIIRSDPSRAVPTGKEGKVILLERVAKYFSSIEAAKFDFINDDEQMNASTRPVSRAEISWPDSYTHGVRHEIKRHDIKLLGNDTFVNETMLALILGLARAADAELLGRITAASPEPFDPAKVAAAGLRMNEVRALVGTNGTAAGWNGAGQFVAAGGVLADTTGDTEQTIIGAFNRSAVAIHEEITLTAERRNLQGDLVFTAYANIVPLVPDPSRFWVAE